MAGEHPDLHHRCVRAREWVSLRLDGELSELERLLLARHLERCEGCRRFAADAEAIVVVVRETPATRPERALEPVPEPAHRLRARTVLAAAAVVTAALAAGAGTLVATLGGSDPARPPVEIARVPPAPPPPTPSPTTGENV
jgi:predicted anti-sigma-YlaC factor YlaD